MNEEKELTRIERELVLQYLRDDNVPVTVTLEEKPGAAETEVSGNVAPVPSKEARLPASVLFPVAIPAEQMTVLDQGIILLKNTGATSRTVQVFLGKTVRVQFYFNHLGLYFVTVMKECSKGLALVVPASIYRMHETPSAPDYLFVGTISFLSHDGVPVKLSCVPRADYPLFVRPSWGDIATENQQAAKALLERFVAQERSENGEGFGNGLHLFSVCRYLVEPPVHEPYALDGAVQPLEMIYVDEQKIVLASAKSDLELEFSVDYQFDLVCTLQAHSLLKRTVRIVCTVERSYTDGERPATCVLCRYLAVQKEDERFLYERMYGRPAGVV